MKRVKKNHIIITALAIMIAAAGYINYAGDLDNIIKVKDKAEEKPGLYLLNTETGVKTLIKEGDGVFKQVTFDEDGANLAFLYCAQKDSCYKAMSLWL